MKLFCVENAFLTKWKVCSRLNVDSTEAQKNLREAFIGRQPGAYRRNEVCIFVLAIILMRMGFVKMSKQTEMEHSRPMRLLWMQQWCVQRRHWWGRKSGELSKLMYHTSPSLARFFCIYFFDSFVFRAAACLPFRRVYAVPVAMVCVCVSAVSWDIMVC